MEQNNLMYSKKPRQNSWLYIAFLILSFVWLEFYPTSRELIYSFQYGYGEMFSSVNLSSVIWSVVFNAVFTWISFEILFWIYRWVLSFKIYSFIVPMDSLKAETRLYFIFRNVILGIFYNLCFLFPYLFAYSLFVEMIVNLTVLIFYAKHLNSVYAESIVGHFVFKNFCYPIFVYEAIEILCSIWVVL